MNRLTVLVRRLPHAANLPLPDYATIGSAGVDLLAALDQTIELPPMGRATIPTGIAISLPSGYEAQIRPRSGLAARQGLTILNAPGTIDSDYRGEIGAILINFGSTSFRVERGMRVAQLVIAPVVRITWQETDELPASERADGGFGSTDEARQ